MKLTLNLMKIKGLQLNLENLNASLNEEITNSTTIGTGRSP